MTSAGYTTASKPTKPLISFFVGDGTINYYAMILRYMRNELSVLTGLSLNIHRVEFPSTGERQIETSEVGAPSAKDIG
jgi:hypothetical protein